MKYLEIFSKIKKGTTDLSQTDSSLYKIVKK